MFKKEKGALGGMRRSRRVWVQSLAMMVGGVLVGALLVGFLGTNDEVLLRIYRGIDTFGKVYKEVSLNYVDEIDPDRFVHAGIDGMLKTLDPYTVYLNERETDELDLVTSGKYAGIGVTIGMRDGAVTVINLMEGFSAAKQGIEVGDRILEVDGKSVKSKSLEEVRLMVRGAVGATVHIKVEREGASKSLDFALIREEIPVRNVTYAGYVGNGIGYIRLERFSRTAGDDVRNAIRDLKEKGTLKGVILDLRGNPGGLLDMAVDVASKFLPESTLVVSTRGRRSDSEQKYYSTETPMVPSVSLALLVDRGTASASEIVAGAIQDVDRGIIVGARTFGKGLVQTITRLSEHSSLKITSGRYYTPSGRSIQEIDYFHRTKEGVFAVKRDSLRREYFTTHKRPVFEGGGIAPDSTVPEETPATLLEELSRKAMFFKYANYFASQRKTTPDHFKLTDDILKDFEAFLKEKDFHYEEEAEAELKELRELAGKARYGKSYSQGIEEVSKAVDAEKARAFERYDKELRTALGLEIIARVKGEKAAIEASFPTDRQLEVAVSLLQNKAAYTRLLAGPPN
jgi:carboxyl-terminal processing protease